MGKGSISSSLNPHPIRIQNGNKNGVKNNVQDSTAGDDEHCFLELAFSSDHHVCALEEVDQQRTSKYNPQILFGVVQDIVTGSGQR